MFAGRWDWFFVVVYFVLMLSGVIGDATYPIAACVCVLALFFVCFSSFSCFVDGGFLGWFVSFVLSLFYGLFYIAQRYGVREIVCAFFTFLLRFGGAISFYVLVWLCLWGRWYCPLIMLFSDIGALR